MTDVGYIPASLDRRGEDIGFHPIAGIFPLMDGDDYSDLVDDIKANGLHEPVITHQGQILDGRNRYRACLEAGVPCRFKTYDGDDPAGFVISLNLKRRHLSASQRGMVAARLETLRHGDNQHTTGDANLHVHRDEASQALNVSQRTVASAAKVRDQGAPELQQAVDHGDVSVSAAADLAMLPEDEQTELVARGKKEILRVASRLKKEKKEKRKEEQRRRNAELAPALSPSSDMIDLYNEPCTNALNIVNAESVDWVVTDPPYENKYLPVYGELARVAEHALKPGGSLLCMVGQAHLPDVIQMLKSERLNYHWPIAYLMPGQATKLFQLRIYAEWKPILWFVKGKFEGDCVSDVCQSDASDKRFHDWGQSESGMRDLMSRFVKPGDVVLDPLMGAGTTGVVALSLGARFIGFDSDIDAYNATLVRINERVPIGTDASPPDEITSPTCSRAV
ncbi:MAG: ParB N-terminal domain-containing protein [bacterium]|nr:ParB N-terminal domain-containing protein [bacterium]